MNNQHGETAEETRRLTGHEILKAALDSARSELGRSITTGVRRSRRRNNDGAYKAGSGGGVIIVSLLNYGQVRAI